jgi:hypothetical protein
MIELIFSRRFSYNITEFYKNLPKSPLISSWGDRLRWQKWWMSREIEWVNP